MNHLAFPKLSVYKQEFFVTFDQTVVRSFDIICEQLAINFECTYVSYALELSRKKRVHYFSNKQWEAAFINEKLIADCPLLEFSQQTNASMLEWNSLTGFMNKQQQKVMQARQSFNIGNGIALRQMFYGMSEIVTLAANKNNKNMSSYILSNLEHVKKYIYEIRLLGISNMLTQGWIENNSANTIIKAINMTQATSILQ